MHAHTYMHMYTHTYSPAHTCTHPYMHARMNTHAHTQAQKHTCECTHVYGMHTHVCMHAHTHTNMPSQTHTCKCTYTVIGTFSLTQILFCTPLDFIVLSVNQNKKYHVIPKDIITLYFILYYIITLYHATQSKGVSTV